MGHKPRFFLRRAEAPHGVWPAAATWVIKSLEENFERVEGIAGGTILGDGNVALIVDVQGLKTSIIHKNAA